MYMSLNESIFMCMGFKAYSCLILKFLKCFINITMKLYSYGLGQDN